MTSLGLPLWLTLPGHKDTPWLVVMVAGGCSCTSTCSSTGSQALAHVPVLPIVGHPCTNSLSCQPTDNFCQARPTAQSAHHRRVLPATLYHIVEGGGGRRSTRYIAHDAVLSLNHQLYNAAWNLCICAGLLHSASEVMAVPSTERGHVKQDCECSSSCAAGLRRACVAHLNISVSVGIEGLRSVVLVLRCARPCSVLVSTKQAALRLASRCSACTSACMCITPGQVPCHSLPTRYQGLIQGAHVWGRQQAANKHAIFSRDHTGQLLSAHIKASVQSPRQAGLYTLTTLDAL